MGKAWALKAHTQGCVLGFFQRLQHHELGVCQGHPGPGPLSHLVIFLLLWPLEISGTIPPFPEPPGVTPSGLPRALSPKAGPSSALLLPSASVRRVLEWGEDVRPWTSPGSLLLPLAMAASPSLGKRPCLWFLNPRRTPPLYTETLPPQMPLQVLIQGSLVSSMLLTWFPSGMQRPLGRGRVRTLTAVMLGVLPYNSRERPLQGFCGHDLSPSQSLHLEAPGESEVEGEGPAQAPRPLLGRPSSLCLAVRSCLPVQPDARQVVPLCAGSTGQADPPICLRAGPLSRGWEDGTGGLAGSGFCPSPRSVTLRG